MQTAFRVASLIIAAALLGAAPPSVPATPAGAAFSAWLKVFDSGTPAQHANFLKTMWPAESKNASQWIGFRQMTGGFDLKKIETSAPTTLTGILEDRNSEQFASFSLTVAASPPHAISEFHIRAIDRPAEFALPPMSQDNLVAALRGKVAKDAAAGRFSGAVLFAKNGNPLFEQAYGLADRAKNIPNTLDTRFRLGSMNKMFTATAIMQLVQAGKVALDAPLGQYVTDYPNKDVAKVTIQQLLTHTGGTGDIFGPKFFANRLKLHTLSDFEKLFGDRGLLFKPGARFDYSNYGFILLGLVIERASGQSYYDYVHDHIYVPAGMLSSGSEPEDQPVPNRSIGYTRSPKGELVPNTDTLPYRGMPAGGGYSTVRDLLSFANALVSYKLLNQHYTQLMTTPQVTMPGGGLQYGYGFGIGTYNGQQCFGHNGGAPGMNGELEICPSSGYVIVALANVDPPAAGGIVDFVMSRLPASSR